MYKWYFYNKKVVILDLESCIENVHLIYLDIIKSIIEELNLDIIFLEEDYFEELTLTQAYNNIINNIDLKNRIPYKTFFNNFISKLHNYILNEDNDIRFKNGFEGFINELREEFGFIIVLKSELRKETTEMLLDKLYFNDYFDLTIFQKDILDPQNLYKDILQQLKKYKLKNKDCVAIEGHPTGTFQTANSNILTIGIRTVTNYQKDFSYKVNLVLSDFNELVGNLDKTYKEAFLELNPDFATKIEEDKKQK